MFLCSCIYHHLETFLGADKWVWADSAYLSLPWCVVPFKQSSMQLMPDTHKIFNQHLSKIHVQSKHFYRSLKGQFQSLCEMQFQIQNQHDLEFANMWMRCCLILHNLILEIEEDLSVVSSNLDYMEEAATWGVPLVYELDDGGEGAEQ
ncbi:hypothetical protein PISMIDRAFT_99114 [Pisolithus microcarpus 441]|uniref:DDE Tnp4 domain-containing protein n=1 Tax=Pisolithus microcarpus 441 TaxID=765257 RepID=A0A0C9ZPD7_9AGAM|nr:hypothetical protein PISMIDRAFT_99114 [Pisolithus microcarpus 441]